uniref:Secreted protein n=1 Tax=Rhipicephalus zambeziensis TaxID=60191 RepID=A0A224YH24_9ACAR
MLMSKVVSLRICSWTLLQIVAIMFHHAGRSAQRRNWKNLLFSELRFILTHVVRGSIKKFAIFMTPRSKQKRLLQNAWVIKCGTETLNCLRETSLLSENWAGPLHDVCSFYLASSS